MCCVGGGGGGVSDGVPRTQPSIQCSNRISSVGITTTAPNTHAQEDCVNQALLNAMQRLRDALRQAFGWELEDSAGAVLRGDEDGPTVVEGV